MFCVNCFHSSTNITNSRPSKKQPSVWRRRRCPNCGALFTTYERPSLADNKPVYYPDGRKEAFNPGKLIISISKAFAHLPEEAAYNSFWLAQTAEDTLSSQKETLTPEEISATAHEVIRHFDELAAVQYAAQHNLITATRKRGRPSLRGRGPQTPPSPSR
jgi:transcriptional repressor NrdR